MKITKWFCFLAVALGMLSNCKSKHTDLKEGFKEPDQVLRIAIDNDPHTLDPRLARDLASTTFLHMLYEGLMRLNYHGKPELGLAESYTLSPDQKTYTFKLRKSVWSNGDPLTAKDFVDTWKSVLTPNFPAPNAYQFFSIKGAKEAKDGKKPLNDVGITALNEDTLVVELESPTPYFLELISTHFFYPVHPKSTEANPIGNGPFKLKNWKRQNEVLVDKNPRYWEAHEVRLGGIAALVLDEQTALRMFENKELDWAGSPLGTLPQDSIASLKHHHRLLVVPAAGAYWFRFNTQAPPFNNVKMRQAFAYAINRKDIVEHITQGGQRPAEAIVPPSFGLKKHAYFEDNNTPKAWFAFQEALEELKISKDDFPVITFCYATGERNHKIAQAVQQQWSKAFGVQIKLENCESQVFYDRLKKGDFQIANGSWFADFRDPINFLDIFKHKSNSTNNTYWENPHYTELLNQSSLELNEEKRMEILTEAQQILMEELPVAPLFFNAFNFVKSDDLLGVYFSDLGFLDFKYAFFSN